MQGASLCRMSRLAGRRAASMIAEIRSTPCAVYRTGYSFSSLPAAVASPPTPKQFIAAPSLFKSTTRRLSSAAGAGYSNCSCPDAFQLISQDNSHVYLDVRTAEEFNAGHPPGAVNVPVMFKSAVGMSPNPDFVSQIKEQFPDKDVSLAVGCQSGKRSAIAADALAAAGYTDLVNVEGGFGAWLGAGLPVEK